MKNSFIFRTKFKFQCDKSDFVPDNHDKGLSVHEWYTYYRIMYLVAYVCRLPILICIAFLGDFFIFKVVKKL